MRVWRRQSIRPPSGSPELEIFAKAWALFAPGRINKRRSVWQGLLLAVWPTRRRYNSPPSIHGGRDASCRSDAGIACHIFIRCILGAGPGRRGGSLLPAWSQLGLSGQLPVRHTLAMSGCRFRHERILRHQSTLCRSAAALITLRDKPFCGYLRGRRVQSGKARSDAKACTVRHSARVRGNVPFQRIVSSERASGRGHRRCRRRSSRRCDRSYGRSDRRRPPAASALA
ncbi:hypothetical protein ACVI1J_003916 [Bradyrhizobium diazoefficiens]